MCLIETVVIVTDISLTLKLEATVIFAWDFVCWHYFLFCIFLTAGGFFSDDILCVPVFQLSILDFLTIGGFFDDDILTVSFGLFDFCWLL